MDISNYVGEKEEKVSFLILHITIFKMEFLMGVCTHMKHHDTSEAHA